MPRLRYFVADLTRTYRVVGDHRPWSDRTAGIARCPRSFRRALRRYRGQSTRIRNCRIENFLTQHNAAHLTSLESRIP